MQPKRCLSQSRAISSIRHLYFKHTHLLLFPLELGEKSGSNFDIILNSERLPFKRVLRLVPMKFEYLDLFVLMEKI